MSILLKIAGTVLVMLLGAGCGRCDSRQILFDVSPDSKKIAFLDVRETFGERLPPEPPVRKSCSVGVCVGDLEGGLSREVAKLEIKRGGKPELLCDFQWRRDSKMLAIRTGRELFVVNVGSNQATRLFSADDDCVITSFAWTTQNQIVVVVRRDDLIRRYGEESGFWMGEASTIEMYKIDPAICSAAKRIFLERTAERRQYTARGKGWQSDELSGSGKYLLYGDGVGVKRLDVESGKIAQAYRVDGEMSGVWWSPTESKCLFSMRQLASAADRKPDWNITYIDRYFISDIHTGSITNISDAIHRLNGMYHDSPSPSLERSPWNQDGSLIALHGCYPRSEQKIGFAPFIQKDWLFSVKSYSAMCLSDKIGSETRGVWFAPMGSWLVIAGENGNDLHACEIGITQSGNIKTLEKLSSRTNESPTVVWSDGGKCVLLGVWPKFKRWVF